MERELSEKQVNSENRSCFWKRFSHYYRYEKQVKKTQLCEKQGMDRKSLQGLRLEENALNRALLLHRVDRCVGGRRTGVGVRSAFLHGVLELHRERVVVDLVEEADLRLRPIILLITMESGSHKVK